MPCILTLPAKQAQDCPPPVGLLESGYNQQVKMMRGTIFTIFLLIVFGSGCGAKPESPKPDSVQAAAEITPTLEPTPNPAVTPLPQIPHQEYERKLNNQLPKDVRQFLEQADNFELFSVTGVAMGNHEPGQEFISAGRFGRAPIQGAVRITDAQVRKDLLESFYDGLVHPSPMAACFAPGHAIRATSGGRSVELTICFACSNFHGTAFGKQIGGSISKAPQEPFNRLLTSAGVQVN